MSAPSDPRAPGALLSLARLALSDREPREILREILAQFLAVFGADAGSIALVNPNSGRLEVDVQFGSSDADHEAGLKPGHGITGWCALSGRSLLASDVRAEPRYIAVRPTARCEMAVPMLASDQVIGVIDLERDVVGGFVPADLELLEELTAEATRVMQRLWQLGHLRGKARQLETLIASGHSLVTKLEQHELFDTLTRDARDLLQAQACAIYLHDPATATLRCAFYTSTGAAPPPAGDLPLPLCLLASAVHTRHAVAFADIQSPEYHDVADLPRDPALHSMLATPLLGEDEVIGVLAVFTGRVHRFDNDQKRLAAALAGIGAVALENSRLYGRVFQSEDALRRNERLTTLGLLAAEIAHEIRNPLTVLKLLHGGLGLNFAEDDPRRTDMRVIGEKLDQVEAIVTRVLNFGKAPSSLHTRCALSEIVEDTLVLLRLKLAQSKVQLHYAAPPQPLYVECHKGQLQQALLNLVFNSMQAMPAGGVIDLRLDGDPNSENPVAAIDVSDTGHGIPEHLRARVFESFLSGRPDGTGLGLAITRRIMQGHHGDLMLVDSGPHGTTMRLTLPLARN